MALSSYHYVTAIDKGGLKLPLTAMDPFHAFFLSGSTVFAHACFLE